MRRRRVLGYGAALPALSLVGCSKEEYLSGEGAKYRLSVSVDVRHAEIQRDYASNYAEFYLFESTEYPGLCSMRGAGRFTLPSGLEVELSCERVPTGHFHFGIDHNGELIQMGKYAGFFTVRMMPPGHTSYIVEIAEKGS